MKTVKIDHEKFMMALYNYYDFTSVTANRENNFPMHGHCEQGYRTINIMIQQYNREHDTYIAIRVVPVDGDYYSVACQYDADIGTYCVYRFVDTSLPAGYIDYDNVLVNVYKWDEYIDLLNGICNLPKNARGV